MDSISEVRLQLVCPALSTKIHLLALMLADENIVFRVTQGLRSWNDQQKLWEQGRDANGNVIDPSKIVTKAPPGHSWHEFGLAVDVVPMVSQLENAILPDWNLSHPVWGRIVAVGESLGLFSGTQFHAIKDEPHFQLTGIFPASPTDEVRQIFRNAGMIAVWTEAGLVNQEVVT